jgi:hypothetical protein
VDEKIVPAPVPAIPERIGRLETLMEDVLRRLNASQEQQSLPSEDVDVSTPSSSSSGLTHDQTALILFDNEIVSHDGSFDDLPNCLASSK